MPSPSADILAVPLRPLIASQSDPARGPRVRIPPSTPLRTHLWVVVEIHRSCSAHSLREAICWWCRSIFSAEVGWEYPSTPRRWGDDASPLSLHIRRRVGVRPPACRGRESSRCLGLLPTTDRHIQGVGGLLSGLPAPSSSGGSRSLSQRSGRGAEDGLVLSPSHARAGTLAGQDRPRRGGPRD
jgi:hypothetical protein